ncbi:MAG TPA: hypothetical protein PLX04_08120 [Caldisericia bacterium]|nr:hypothetical protein [Caldisericia bacterium]
MSTYTDWLAVYADLASRLGTATGLTVYQIDPLMDKFQLTVQEGAYISLGSYLPDSLPIGGTMRRRIKVYVGVVVKVTDPEKREPELAKAKCLLFDFIVNITGTTPAIWSLHNKPQMSKGQTQSFVVAFIDLDIRF